MGYGRRGNRAAGALMAVAPPPPGSHGAADPSMDDILASIRRILNEDELQPTPADATPDDTLLLDGSMLVVPGGAVADAVPTPGPGPAPALVDAAPASPVPDEGLVAADAAAAASSSVAMLVQALASNRGTQTHRQGPTIEDLVRDEMRPILKAWLDLHLPPLVERLVRTEIERVVSRTTG